MCSDCRQWWILTISILPVSQGWRHGDDASLSHTHSQKALVHSSDQPPDTDVCVVGAQTSVAAEEEGVVRWRRQIGTVWRFSK